MRIYEVLESVSAEEKFYSASIVGNRETVVNKLSVSVFSCLVSLIMKS